MELVRDGERLAIVSFRFLVTADGVVSNVTAVRGMPASKCGDSGFMLDGKRYLQSQLWKVIDGNLDRQKQMVVRDSEPEFDKAVDMAKRELGLMIGERLSQITKEAEMLKLSKDGDVALRVFEYGYK